MRRAKGWTRVKGVEWQHMACTTPRFPSHWWCKEWHGYGPVHHQEDGKSDELDEGVEHNNGVGEVSGCHETMVCWSSLCGHPVSPQQFNHVHNGVCELRSVTESA